MRQTFTLLLLMGLLSANRINGQITPSELQTAVDAGVDPYFVESKDTVSKYGPRCITRDVLQDRNGNYWLATWQGIMKYDGKLFTNYTLKEGLVHFHVLSIFEDSRGNLWFGTARGGLYLYNGKSFTLFTTRNGLTDNTVLCMAEDKEGHVWFGTYNGASRYNLSTGPGTSGKTFTNFTSREGLASNTVNSMICDRTGKLWFGGEGITWYDGKSFSEFKNEKSQPVKKVISLFEDKAGKIWIGRFDGLSRYDPSVRPGTGSRSFTDLLSNFLTYYIVDDKAGNIWLTHSEPNKYYTEIPNQVLYKYDGKKFKKILEKYEPSDWQIFGKTVDKAGNIWFGTMQGVYRYDGRSVTGFAK